LQIIFFPGLPVKSMNISDQEQVFQVQDSVKHKADTSVHVLRSTADTVGVPDSVPHKKFHPLYIKQITLPADTTSFCARNAISDVTFYDSLNLLTRINEKDLNRFPFVFTEKNMKRENALKSVLTKHLKDGKEIPVRPFHEDWIILVVLVAAFLYSSIRTFSRNLFPEIIRFFSFRGVGDPGSGDIGEVYHWQSTVVNLISFFNIALFIYCAASYYDFIPAGVSGILFWAIAFLAVALIVTFRHLVCFVTGYISGQKKIFNEYMVTVYQLYRYTSLILFVLVILLSYTDLFSAKTLFTIGLTSFLALYLIRIIRLLLIFIKMDVSVLYLILYLCALEFLPVLVTAKYFTGLF
jgi:hypothetical protein